MIIDEVEVIPVKPAAGLIAFASVVIDKNLYLGSIAVYSRRDGSGYRITFPTKRIGQRQLNIYYPVSKEFGKLIESAIIAKCDRLFPGNGS